MNFPDHTAPIRTCWRLGAGGGCVFLLFSLLLSPSIQGQTLQFVIAALDSASLIEPEKTRIDQGRSGEFGPSAQLPSVDWSSQNRHFVPTQIDTLRFRPKVDLSLNKIRRMPSRVVEFRTDSLDLSGNRIRTIHYRSWSWLVDRQSLLLPSNLHYLNLSGNRFKTLALWKISQTAHVDLSWNRIGTVTQTGGYNRTLEVLNLEGNRLKQFPGVLRYCIGLVELDLSHNGMVEMNHPIHRLDQLQILDLSHNDLTRVHRSIKRLYNLKVLDLRGNPIEGRELERLQRILPEGCELLLD